MNDLIFQKRSLKRKKNIANSISNLHIPIGSVGISLLTIHIENKTLKLIGGIIFSYWLLYFGIAAYPLISYISDLESEVRKIDRSIEDRQKVHISLDSLRNSMLFDDYPTYWQVIQELDPKGFHMNDLALKKSSLKLKKNIIKIINESHFLVPAIGMLMTFSMYDTNPVLASIGIVLVLYFCIWAMYHGCIINRYICNKEREILEIDQSIEKIQKAHASLDSLRNSMLFDDDLTYWQVIEKLD